MKSELIALIILCTLVVQVVSGSAVAAQEGIWEVLESEPATFDTSPYCPTYVQELSVESFASRQNVCVFEGESIKVGNFLAGGEPRLAIAYPLESEFHPVEGVCRGMAGCVYSPAGDILVARYPISSTTSGATIFRHFEERIRRTFLGNTGVTYTFDTSSPDYVLVGQNNSPLSIGSVAVSQNGKWAVIEEKNVGVSLINLNDFTMKRVLSPGPFYGFGKDPREELAISNDGSTVVLMGENAGFTIVHVTSTCGGISNEACPQVMPQTTAFTPSFRFSAHPSFDRGGGQLSFYVATGSQPNRRVVLKHPGYEVTRMKYLALGDSYSSGEGETSDAFYQMGTNDGLDHCHVSVRSYAFVIGALMNIPSGDTKNIACAGAKIIDVVGDDASYRGQAKGLASDAQRAIKQTSALDSFEPGWVHQESFVSRYQPEIITLGIGGNDAGLMAKLKTCAMPGLCEWVATAEARLRTGNEIQHLFDRLVSAYHHLRADSLRSQLYAVGYPQIINTEGICDPITALLLSHEERVFMRQGISYLNEVISRAAESVGVSYVDVEDSLKDRELCSGSISPAINGLRLGDDIALSKNLPLLKIIGSETFHPTPEGHKLLGEMIINRYGDLTQSRICTNCLLGSKPPPLPDYFGGSTVQSSAVNQFAMEVLSYDHVDPDEPTIEVIVPPGTLEPRSSVRIEIHSESLSLGETMVDDNGGFSRKVTIPKRVEEGFHSLHIYGTSYSHTAVDLYQAISYGEISESTTAMSVSASPEKVSQKLGNSEAATLGAMTFQRSQPTRNYQGSSSSLIANSRSIFSFKLVLMGLVAVVAVLATIAVWLKRKHRRHQKSPQDLGG